MIRGFGYQSVTAPRRTLSAALFEAVDQVVNDVLVVVWMPSFAWSMNSCSWDAADGSELVLGEDLAVLVGDGHAACGSIPWPLWFFLLGESGCTAALAGCRVFRWLLGSLCGDVTLFDRQVSGADGAACRLRRQLWTRSCRRVRSILDSFACSMLSASRDGADGSELARRLVRSPRDDVMVTCMSVPSYSVSLVYLLLCESRCSGTAWRTVSGVPPARVSLGSPSRFPFRSLSPALAVVAALRWCLKAVSVQPSLRSASSDAFVMVLPFLQRRLAVRSPCASPGDATIGWFATASCSVRCR